MLKKQPLRDVEAPKKPFSFNRAVAVSIELGNQALLPIDTPLAFGDLPSCYPEAAQLCRAVHEAAWDALNISATTWDMVRIPLIY